MRRTTPGYTVVVLAAFLAIVGSQAAVALLLFGTVVIDRPEGSRRAHR